MDGNKKLWRQRDSLGLTSITIIPLGTDINFLYKFLPMNPIYYRLPNRSLKFKQSRTDRIFNNQGMTSFSSKHRLVTHDLVLALYVYKSYPRAFTSPTTKSCWFIFYDHFQKISPSLWHTLSSLHPLRSPGT